MGKQRKIGKTVKSSSMRKQAVVVDDNTLDPTARSYVYDEVDDFHHDREEALLRDVTFKLPQTSHKEHVLGIGDSSDSENYSESEESDQDQMYIEDDILEKQEEHIPDERAWGKKKHLYFHTDTTDEKLIHVVKSGKSEEFCQLEGAAARKFQERLDAQVQDLPEDDLLIPESCSEKNKSTVKLDFGGDLSLLTDKQRKRLLKQQSPEFFLIAKDFEEKYTELSNNLKPLMEALEAHKIKNTNLERYITTRFQLVSYYVTNICAYFMLKCEADTLAKHPVINRLTQYKRLLQKLEPIHQTLKPKLEEICASLRCGDPLDIPTDPNYLKNNKKKLLKVLGTTKNVDFQISNEDVSRMLEGSDDEMEDNDKVITTENNEEEFMSINPEQENSDDHSTDTEYSEEENTDERRGITYQMIKNKGLLPSRRRDQQNPRVKYRMKYAKKLKLRKGQVRQVRNEQKKYTGEKSGINVRAIKSVKLK